MLNIESILDNVGVLGEGETNDAPQYENKSPHKSPQRPERPGSAMRIRHQQDLELEDSRLLDLLQLEGLHQD